MLSRARGLLPARVGYGRPVTGIRFIVGSTKTRVNVIRQPHGNQDGEKSTSSQNAAAEWKRLREETRGKESNDTQRRPANKKQIEETENRRAWNRIPKDARDIRGIPLSGRVAFGVITTSRPSDTSLDELVKDIEPLPSAKFSGNYENPTQLVILLTPGLARYALDSNLSEALYQRFKMRRKPGVQVETTSAIVDRLPAERGNPEGSEGMAYMLFRSPPMAKPEDRTAFQQSAQKPGSLTFRMPRWALRHNFPDRDYEFQLPLSQTVFTTGLVSTLIHRTFSVDTHRLRPSALKLLDEQRLESQTLQLPAVQQGIGTQYLNMPLVPLTPLRRIDYVMGNIIRKLSSQPAGVRTAPENEKIDQTKGSEVGDTSFPASQELEKSVSKYFEALDLQPETVSVWALVVPPEPEYEGQMKVMTGVNVRNLIAADEQSIASAWHSRTEAGISMAESTSNAIRRLLPYGARLIRVLSGGGGWGKKAGLLSLDPDVQYSTRDLRQDQGWEFDFDGVDDGTETATEAQKNKALGQIVKEGERIMFLIAPKAEHVPDTQTHPKDTGWEILLDLTFGAIPSSIDLAPRNVASDTNGATIRHYPGRFGMLSEGGMAVTINMKKRRFQSKLDVPYGTYVFHHHDRNYFPLQSAAQWDEFLAGGSETSRDSASQQTQSTEQAEETAEPLRITYYFEKTDSARDSSQASAAQQTQSTEEAEATSELAQIRDYFETIESTWELSQASAAQQHRSIEEAEETTEPAQTESSSDNTKLADLFQSFAEHDETRDAQMPPADQKEETSNSLSKSQ